MDSEDFYDSLDEDTVISGATIKPKKRVTIEEIEQVDFTSLVPLYEKETHKEDIKRPNKIKNRIREKNVHPSRTDVSSTRNRKLDNESGKTSNFSSKLEDNNDVQSSKRSLRANSKCSIFSNSSMCSVLDSKPKNTYLDLFHKKIGFVKSGDGNDTTRALKGDDTFRSAQSSQSGGSEFSDAVSFVSDGSSFYMNYLEEERQRKDEANADTGLDDSSSSLTGSKFNLQSVSELSLKSNKPKRLDSKKSDASFKTAKSKNSVEYIPTLGRLGPDPEAVKEKMQKLKRQQSYGQKVSNENRMRMLELRVIKNFNKEMKKSSEINKSAKNIIIT